MINQAEKLAAILDGIGSYLLGVKEGSKNILLYSEDQRKNKSEHKQKR